MHSFIYIIYNMIKFKQFKSWFKKAYPDIELKKTRSGFI